LGPPPEWARHEGERCFRLNRPRIEQERPLGRRSRPRRHLFLAVALLEADLAGTGQRQRGPCICERRIDLHGPREIVLGLADHVHQAVAAGGQALLIQVRR
jgi:hypothetical protein